MILFYLLLLSSSQVIQSNHRNLASSIDCKDYSTKGDWSYIIYDGDMKCYDSNPDKSKYDQSGNLLLRNSQQIYLASKEKIFTCDVACIACLGPTKSDCVECVSPTRGTLGYPSVADIVAKKTMDCTCRKGFVDNGNQHCNCPDGMYQDIPTNYDELWGCFDCPYIFQKCSYNSGSNVINAILCRLGVGRSTDTNKRCACETGYHENQPITADCVSDCEKPCSKCQQGSNKLCSVCFDGLMIYDPTVFTCTCPPKYYMNLTDYRCYACHETCQSCNGQSNANCLSCIITSQRLMQSGYCNCPPHFVTSTQVNCVPCDWSCDNCDNTDSCRDCIDADNRKIGDSKYCVCKPGFAEDLNSSLCVTCQYTCATCEYQFDTCTSCPSDSNRQLSDSQCKCKDYYYDVGVKTCDSCHFTCKQCNGPSDINCTLCDNSIFRYLNNYSQCVCQSGYGYIDQNTLECQLCSQFCLTCNQIEECLTCPLNSNRIINQNNQCICDDGYYDSSQIQCLKCHFTCQTCNGASKDNCLSCNYDKGRELKDTQCSCLQGYYEFYKICTPCYYTCLTCVNQFQDGCTSCPTSRRMLNNNASSQCVCNSIAQIDDGKSLECTDCHYTCQTCSGTQPNNCLTCYETQNVDQISRQIKFGICSCPQYWFDDGQSEICQQCHASCLSCFDTTNQGCIECSELDFRIQLSNSCLCMDGYFEEINFQQKSCNKCHYSCETCELGYKLCLTCPVGSLRSLKDDQSCSCPETHPNDVEGNPICQSCHFSCSNCTGIEINMCTMCSDENNRVLNAQSNCECKQSYYEIGFSECASCIDICQNCKNTADYCTSCDPNQFRVLSENTCICGTRFGTQYSSYYDNLLDPECVACHYSCYTCSGIEYNQCSTCSDLDFRDQQGTECVCKPKYIDNGEGMCMLCNYSCDTCQGTKYYCTSCPENSLRTQNTQSQSCECPLRYYDAGIPLCQKCDQNCESCQSDSMTCLSCVFGTNRIYNQLTYTCDCLSGYYDNGDGTCSICHFSCLQCSGPLKSDCNMCPDFTVTNRYLSSNSCICSDEYFDDHTNQMCQICSSTCFTCQDNKNTCTQCLESQNRSLNGSSCSCISRYYDSGSDICQQCSNNCLECQNLPNQCTKCDSGLNIYLKQQKCECLDGFYDDQQLQCQPCHFSCQTCSDLSICTSCDQNNLRELINGECICKQGSIEQGIKLCAICDSRCLSCETQIQQCTTCATNLNRTLNGNQCFCKDGYFENTLLICEQCVSNCLTCIQSSTKCISCISNKVVDSGVCVCKNGYYTDSDSNCQICSNQCLLCQQSATYCLSCNINRQLIDNKCICLDGQYDDGQVQCQYCDYSCEKCSGSTNNCITCSQASKRYLSGSQCLCKIGFYDIGSYVCQQCHYSCLTCQGIFTNCLTCDNNRELDGNQCKCKAGYFDNGALCAQCDVQCKTCTESSNKCTSCEINTFRDDQSLNFNQCPCQKGFYDDSNKMCKQCSYQCINCIGSATNCTACYNNPGYYRINTLPQCNCQDGYFDDGIQVICQKCSSSCLTCVTKSTNCLRCETPRTRSSTPNCDCKEGYYLNNEKCKICSIQCQTCSNSDSCITCKPDRIFKNKTQCICQDGYYEAKQTLCQLCSHKCSTCQDDALNCLVCAQDRINPPNCVCKDHYYDDQINNDCQVCDQYCGNCNIIGCIDCAANRILQGKTCVCPIDSISYQDTPWCSNCDVAVVKGIFSDDLNNIQYKFEYPLQFYFTTQVDIQQYCQKVLTTQSLVLLGYSPQCSILDDVLIIKLGDGSTVVVGDSITFNSPPNLKHTNCQNQLTMILKTVVNKPINIIKPSILLDYPISPISPCSLAQINIVKQMVSGLRNLKLFWQSSVSLKEINQANEFQFQTLTIEQGSLPENANINVTIQYTNFLKQQGISQITIKTLSSSTPQFQFQTTKKQYFSWSPIKLLLYYSNKVCSDKYQQTLSDDIVIEFSEIIQLRNPQQSNQIEFSQTKFYLNDSERIISTVIPARTLSINSNYSIQASYQDLINSNSLNTQFDFQIQKSPLFVQIVGGTRIVNYMKPFTIQVQAKDPDFQTEWNTDSDIQLQVTCMDIQHNNQPCKDMFNKTIPLNVTSDIQYIKQKLFNPFSVILFKVVCKKQDLVSSDQVSIIFLDIDLPTLNVSYPIGYTIRDVNINEQLQFQIQLDSNQLIKNMDFSYALVYDYELVYVKFIPTQSLKFAIWDNFINFNFINKIFVKQQAHDLNYLMPQICSIQLSVNMPPVMSIVTVQPQLGNAFFTDYKIRVQNSKDTDSPIQYRFAYYQSLLLYESDIHKGRQDNLIILQDFSSQQTFTGILESGNLTLIISIQDSLGSTVNYTQQVISQSFNEQQSKDQACLQFVQQFTNQTYDYGQSIVLSQELLKLLNTNIAAECSKQIHTLLTICQQNLYIQLQLQTNLNVQTRISNLLGQFENMNQKNTRRFAQTANQICVDNNGFIQFDQLQQIENQSEPSTLKQNLVVLYIQGNRAIQQNIILTQDYQNTINIADDQTFRNLQQNIILRKSLIRVLSSLYQQAFESRFFIRTLINNLTDSFQLNLEVDQSGIKLNSDIVGVQTSKIGQLSFQKYVTMEQQDDEYLDLSNFQINRFIQISKYFNNVFLYSENFTSQFINGSYKIEEIDNQNQYYLKSIILTDYLLYDPFIYVDNKNQVVQVGQIYKGKLAFDMGQQLNQCNSTQLSNQSISKYSFVCSIYIYNEWRFDQCQIDYQTDYDGKINFICYCSKVGPITLMIQNITHFNKTIITKHTLDINQYIIIYLNLNLFNILIVSSIIFLLIFMLLYKRIKIIITLDDTKSSQISMLTDQQQTLTQQPKMSKQLLKRNFKYLHEILRVVTTRYLYLPLFPRVLLITFNISVSLTILHIFNAILGKYIISITISLIGSLLLQFTTKILEGFFNGPKILKYIGYVLIHLLIIGLFVINTVFINSNNVIYEIICAILSLIILYGPIEIIIQYIRLSLAFKMYDQLKQEPFNPIINFVYYFVQDEVIAILIKGGIIE